MMGTVTLNHFQTSLSEQSRCTHNLFFRALILILSSAGPEKPDLTLLPTNTVSAKLEDTLEYNYNN